MKKLKLRIDELRIDSFRTTRADAPTGTVVGEQLTGPLRCGEGTCVDYGTCCYSCGPTCRGSCPPDTCYQTCRADETCYMAAC